MVFSRLQRQRGLSIVELMVALVLSSILTVGLVQIFTSNSQTFRLNDASARVQESGRMASDMLSRAIRNADYWGCTAAFGGADGVDSMLNDVDDFHPNFFLAGLAGEHNVPENNEFGALPGSDVVIFGGQETNSGLRMNQRTSLTSAAINTGQGSDQFFNIGDIIIVTDCRSANMLQITQFNNNGIVANTGGSTSPGNASQHQNEFQPGATVFRPSRTRFFVREMGNGNRALVFNPRRNATQMDDGDSGEVGEWMTPVELVNDIWDLRIEFGRDTSGNGRVNIWSVPGPENEADETIAVRFSLLVRSPQENVLEEAQSYCFPGWLDCSDADNLTEADDRNLYRVYTSTTSLRNRLGN